VTIETSDTSPVPLVDLKLNRAAVGIGSGSLRPGVPTLGATAFSIAGDAADWPDPLQPEAYHGIAGDFVRVVEQYSEASPAALLAHFLTMAGCLIGPDCHAAVGGAVHPGRLFIMAVGKTAHARKGTAASDTKRVLFEADPTFHKRVVEGLSSGEGLIYNVRDPVREWSKPTGPTKQRELVTKDAGETDKRLCVIESEFAGALRTTKRDGNTLTAVLRRAWDDGSLRTLIKNSPNMATGAHVCIIGHITREELNRELTSTDQASGLANRFIWIATHRAKLLPRGEQVPQALLAPITQRLQAIQSWANIPRHLERDLEAADLWDSIYPVLSDDRPGLLGHVTNRAEAQVLRLSVIYAALDRSAWIRAEHLLAALAVWTYAEASAAWIFGAAKGDPIADEILAALRLGPKSRTEIRDLFSGHQTRDRIDAALRTLQQAGLADLTRDAGNGGRPRDDWHAI
jgi:hypothetical protein